RFMIEVLGDDTLKIIPVGAPGLTRFDVHHFLADGSPWREHKALMFDTIADVMKSVVRDVRSELGDPAEWAYGKLHQVRFWHRLRQHEPWQPLQAGPDPTGGSATTLRMAAHVGNGPGADPGVDEVPCRAAHGPVYRLVVDLADPDHCRFVICGGNSARPGSAHIVDHYPAWLKGEYFQVSLVRDELTVEETWSIEPLSEDGR
ncbi:MAG: penicillin acylase family protein, partial [Gammaproteobacteria bacterium]|nr:penicillin acylase family protein [Gammaproteobacteria bacterium]